MRRATSPQCRFLNGRAHLGALLREAYGVTVAWTLPAHDVSGTAFRWNENSMPFRAGTAVIWDAGALRMSRGGREMRNLLQRETVNEAISLMDEFRPLSRRQ